MTEPAQTAASSGADLGNLRPVLTFKPRRGRMTSGQRRALEDFWPLYGVAVSTEPLDLERVFGRVAPLVLEVGFGMGEATAELARAEPQRDVLAVDVHTPGAGALLQRIADGGLTNVRVLIGDAVDVLRFMLLTSSLDEIRAFFPDPWPKGKHVKRRLVSPAFATLAVDRLRPGGTLALATDWAPYAAQMLEVVAADPLLHNEFGGFAPRPNARPITRFEAIATARGHVVHDVVARRVAATTAATTEPSRS